MALMRSIRSWRTAALLSGVLALTACGEAADTPLSTAARAIGGVISDSALFGGGDDAAGPVQLTPEVAGAILNQFPNRRLLLVETLDLGSSAIYTRVGVNGSTETWEGAEGYSIALTENGVLRSTRGIGYDLMASDVRSTAASLRARRTGPADRLSVRLNGDLEEVSTVYDCEIHNDGREQVQVGDRFPTLTRFTETCRGGSDFYDNTYWVDGSGMALRSEQWVGPVIGRIRLTYLRN